MALCGVEEAEGELGGVVSVSSCEYIELDRY